MPDTTGTCRLDAPPPLSSLFAFRTATFRRPHGAATAALLLSLVIAVLPATTDAQAATMVPADGDTGITTFSVGNQYKSVFDEIDQLFPVRFSETSAAILCEAGAFHIIRAEQATNLSIARIQRIGVDGSSWEVGVVHLDFDLCGSPGEGLSFGVAAVKSTVLNKMLVRCQFGYQYFQVPGTSPCPDCLLPATDPAVSWSDVVGLPVVFTHTPANLVLTIFDACTPTARLMFVQNNQSDILQLHLHTNPVTGSGLSKPPPLTPLPINVGDTINITDSGILDGENLGLGSFQRISQTEAWFISGANLRFYTIDLPTGLMTVRMILTAPFQKPLFVPPVTIMPEISPGVMAWTYSGDTHTTFISRINATVYTYRRIQFNLADNSLMELTAGKGVIYHEPQSGALFLMDRRGAVIMDASLDLLNFVSETTCPVGESEDGTYTGFGSVSCENINECTAGSFHDCQPLLAECSDTPGSFTCTCVPGAPSNGTLCVDLDECALQTHDCGATVNVTCQNTPGSFACPCSAGYTGSGCNDDVDECALGPPAHNCDTNAACGNTFGSFTCACNAGYAGAGTAGTCAQSDECALGPPNHDCDTNAACTDTPGSFTCACNLGYEGNGTSCSDADECALGPPNHDCDTNAACGNTVGSFSCTCNTGYQGSGTAGNCADVDECALGPPSDNCDASTASCSNTAGSFNCVCNPGFAGAGTVSPPSPCVDINECTSLTHDCAPPPKAFCTNFPGSYFCSCAPGWTGNGTTCEDLDECAADVDNCHDQATCTNLVQPPDKFSCACNAGYSGDGVTCTNVDECTGGGGGDNCSPHAECTDTVGSFTCACNAGFFTNATSPGPGVVCYNENECAESSHNCHSNAECTDTAGNFTCACAPGYAGDGVVSCTNIDECGAPVAPPNNNDNCDPNAVCADTVGSFSCTCDPKWNGAGSNGVVCLDSNECIGEGPSGNDCAAVGGVCTNTPGSFTCACNSPGFVGPGTVCFNVDECQGPSCHTEATCTDTPGSFTCACNTGYQGSGTSCTDIDECALGPPANTCEAPALGGECTNTPGSFTCACVAPGWVGNGTSCANVDECALGPPNHNCDVTAPGNAACTDTPGSFTCACEAGYHTLNAGATCIDDNECVPPPLPGTGTADCDANAGCTNEAGGFLCTCNAGYVGNGTSCANKDECALDVDDCDDDASCADTIGSFTCSCNAGFVNTATPPANGTACADIDECAAATHNCAPLATCADTAGSFTCTCVLGYESGDFGVTCTNKDECASSTDDCHSDAACTDTIGSFTCACNPGFVDNPVPGGQPVGTICVDQNECIGEGTGNNCDGNATCTNSPGAFSCACNPGFGGAGTVGTCVNLNECTIPSHNCDTNAACVDTTGAFPCTCNAGYAGAGTNGTCVSIDECTIPVDDCDNDATCTDTTGSFTCACNTGFSGSGTAGNCVDNDECALGPPNHDCHPNAVCGNTVGSFICTCATGYAGNGTQCADINECALGPPYHDCTAPQETCVNTIGSFTCPCTAPGYASNGTECVNVDECALGPPAHDCDPNAACADTQGSFTCACNPGYLGAGTNGTCADVDECTGGGTGDNCALQANCFNTVGSFVCACFTGFAQDINGTVGDGTVCENIDECNNNLDNCHPTRATCADTFGAFTCACNVGWQGPGANGVTCPDTDECAAGPPQHDCDVTPGTASACTNTPGSFACACNPGWTDNTVPGTQPAGTDCVTVSECTLSTDDCDDNALCAETVGSFTCACNTGYTGAGTNGTCLNDNECLGEGVGNSCDITPPGAASCTDTQGSFTCACEAPFSGLDGTACIPPSCANNSALCHPLAACQDVPVFGVACWCPTQFVGDGFFVCRPTSANLTDVVVVDFEDILLNGGGFLQVGSGLAVVQLVIASGVPLTDSLNLISIVTGGPPGDVDVILDFGNVLVNSTATTTGGVLNLQGVFRTLTIRNADLFDGSLMFTVAPGTVIGTLVFDDFATRFSSAQLVPALRFVGTRLLLDLVALVQGFI